MKKTVLAAALAAMLVVVTGCMMRELSDVGVIKALSIDMIDDRYTITAAMLGDEGEIQYITAEGHTLAEVKENLSQDSYPFFGQNDLILIGEQVKNIRHIVQATFAEDDTKGTAHIAICHGKALDIMKLMGDEGRLQERQKGNSAVLATSLRVLENSMKSMSRAAVMPYYTFDEEGSVDMSKMVVVVDYRVERVLEKNEQYGVRWMLGEAAGTALSLNILDDMLGISVISQRTNVTATERNGKPAFDIAVDFDFELMEESGEKDWMREPYSGILKQQAELVVEEQIKQAIGAAQATNGDFLGLAAYYASYSQEPIANGGWMPADMDFSIKANAIMKFGTVPKKIEGAVGGVSG